jgi:hypothetical protein
VNCGHSRYHFAQVILIFNQNIIPILKICIIEYLFDSPFTVIFGFQCFFGEEWIDAELLLHTFPKV